MTWEQIKEKLFPGVRTPTWDDIAYFWDNSSKKKRIEYTAEALDCTRKDKILRAIIKREWNSLPDFIQLQIADYSQLENDVDETINEEANKKWDGMTNEQIKQEIDAGINEYIRGNGSV